MIISKGFMLPKIKLLTLVHSEIVYEKLIMEKHFLHMMFEICNVTPETVKFIS